MKRFILVLAFFNFVSSIHGDNYIIVFKDEEIFKPCEGEEDNFLSKWFDLSNMTAEFVDDNEIIVNGNFKSICPVPSDATPNLEVKFIKMVGGRYGLSIAQINRNDLCASLFDPREMWYKYIKHIDKKYRTCPPVPGTIYAVHNSSTKDLKFWLPDPNLAGEYRYSVRSRFLDNSGPSICFGADFRMDKI